jgi:hypothetical protein
MNKILLFFCIVISLLSAQLKWYLDLGFRFNFYELFILCFLLCFFVLALSNKIIHVPQQLRTFILFQWGLLILSIFSGCAILFNFQHQDSFFFYEKAVLQLLIYTTFFTCLIVYLSGIHLFKRELILKSYIWGVVISSIYGIAQIAAIIYYGIDLDVYIHSVVPFFQETASEFEVQAYGDFYRLSGLPGDPNVHASYAMTALPFIFYYAFQRKQWVYAILSMVVILSMIFSISVSGIVASFITISVYIFLFRRKTILGNIMTILFVLTPIIIVLFLYEDQVYRFISVKLDPSGTGLDRYNIALQSIEIFAKYPFGIGFNSFSLAYEDMFRIAGYNPHNSWIAILVELGFIGLIYQLVFTIYIFISALKSNNDMAKLLVCSYTGICVASIGYSSLNLFFTQFVVTMLFSAFVCDQSTQHIKPFG